MFASSLKAVVDGKSEVIHNYYENIINFKENASYEIQEFKDDITAYPYGLNFTSDELITINKLIESGDSDEIYKFLENKKAITDKAVKDNVLGNIDNSLDFIVRNASKIDNASMTRNEFLNKLSDYEKLAVQLSDFYKQIISGGFYTWYKNNYYKDFDPLYKFVKSCTFEFKDSLINMFNIFSNAISSFEKLDLNDEWNLEDFKSRLKSLENADMDYRKIRDKFMNYLETYLYDNMSNEYLEKVKEYKFCELGIEI